MIMVCDCTLFSAGVYEDITLHEPEAEYHQFEMHQYENAAAVQTSKGWEGVGLYWSEWSMKMNVLKDIVVLQMISNITEPMQWEWEKKSIMYCDYKFFVRKEKKKKSRLFVIKIYR